MPSGELDRHDELSEQDIEKCIDEAISVSTKRQTKWGVGIFRGNYDLEWMKKISTMNIYG
jgi:hypothetical protein